jgi:hypothetical protein
MRRRIRFLKDFSVGQLWTISEHGFLPKDTNTDGVGSGGFKVEDLDCIVLDTIDLDGIGISYDRLSGACDNGDAQNNAQTHGNRGNDTQNNTGYPARMSDASQKDQVNDNFTEDHPMPDQGSCTASPQGLPQHDARGHVWVCTSCLLFLNQKIPAHERGDMKARNLCQRLSIWPPFDQAPGIKARRTGCQCCRTEKFCLPIIRVEDQGETLLLSQDVTDEAEENEDGTEDETDAME